MADRCLRRHLSQDEMNRGIGMLHSRLSQRNVAMSLVCPRVLSPECGTGLLRPEMHAGGRERSTNEVQD